MIEITYKNDKAYQAALKRFGKRQEGVNTPSPPKKPPITS
jgi:hypothetical protein